MIKYDGEVVYSESGSGIKSNTRLLFNEAQVSAIKAIARDELKQRTDLGIVYLVENKIHDLYGDFNDISVFENLHDAEEFIMENPRSVLVPRKVIKHGQIKK